MSNTSGTANGFMDLLDKLDAFLCDRGHTWGMTYSGTGNGEMYEDHYGGVDSVAETFTMTATNSTTFSVVGSVSGSLGTATANVQFTSTKVNFTIAAGPTDFVAGDTFTLNTSPKWTRMRYAGCVGKDYRSGTNWSTNSSNAYTKAFDGGTGCAYSLGTPAYLTVEFYQALAVTNFNLSCGDSTVVTPKNITLQFSNDGAAWYDKETWTNLVWTTVQERKQFTVAAPTSHKYWRVAFTDPQTGQTTVRVTELEFFTNAANEWQAEDRFEFLWKAPGLDGTKEIFVGGYTYQDQAANIHNLNFVGFRFYNSAKTVTAQQNPSGAKCLPLNNQPMSYRFVANGQRVIVIAIPSGNYETAYLGFGFPYETPSIHPFPAVIGACSDNEAQTLADADADHRAFFNPTTAGLAAYYPDNYWRNHANRYQVSGTSDGGADTTSGKVWPWSFNHSGGMLDYVRDQIDGGFTLLPAILLHNVGGVTHAFGELDGVYFVTGFNNSAGTIIEQGVHMYFVVQNIARTGVQDYAAIKLD